VVVTIFIYLGLAACIRLLAAISPSLLCLWVGGRRLYVPRSLSFGGSSRLFLPISAVGLELPSYGPRGQNTMARLTPLRFASFYVLSSVPFFFRRPVRGNGGVFGKIRNTVGDVLSHGSITLRDFDGWGNERVDLTALGHAR